MAKKILRKIMHSNSMHILGSAQKSGISVSLFLSVSFFLSLSLCLSLTYTHKHRPHTYNFLLRNCWAMQEMSVLFSITVLNIFLSLSTFFPYLVTLFCTHCHYEPTYVVTETDLGASIHQSKTMTVTEDYIHLYQELF